MNENEKQELTELINPLFTTNNIKYNDTRMYSSFMMIPDTDMTIGFDSTEDNVEYMLIKSGYKND